MNHEGTERSTPPGAPAEGTGPVSGTGSVSRTGPGASAGAGTGGDRQPRAVVVGGGLAGITAALQLAESGVHVTLLEGRPRLGGLAFSFRRGDLTVDNGQHVYLRCCTAYRWFLDRVDGAGLAPLQDRLDVPVLDVAHPRGPRLGRIRRDSLPVPLHLARSLATYPHLSLAERASVGRAALALKKLDPADPALDGIDFATWLGRHGQSPRTVEALWDLVGIPTLNAPAPQASMGLAAMVFKTGLLSEPGAADIGWAHVPLGELHDTRPTKELDALGVRTLLRTKAERISRTDDGRWAVDVPGERIEADTVVLAVPQHETHGLLPEGALDDPDRLLDIDTAPILNLHVVYDRKVLKRPFFTALGSPVQWVFDRTDSSGLLRGGPEGPSDKGGGGRRVGQYLAVSQSAAQDEIDEPVAALRAKYLPELERLLPAARGAGIRDFFVTRERTATFAPTPGVGRLRPGARTRAPGLYLAGAWTATGWPATMEGAVRSGFSAAGAALSALGRRHDHPLQEAV
ncbi:hydroxysqualene dehydroxylase HpnE [Streptomyces sp. NPDC053792]|uniref:hydroxysqualene dehydroxylase HpnE n=1 Tax=Streptomyces sp. NPDC053792 TaxID=3365716 RepID=UPI0037D470B6